MRENSLHRKALQCLEATIGIESNREMLLPDLPYKREVKSLLTDFKEVVEIPYSQKLDGYVRVEDTGEKPSWVREGDRVRFQGSLQRLTQEASDLRFSLWGNQGFLYRFILYLLEKKHRIYNFHACGLYDDRKDKLFVIIGGAGSGKTVYLLSGLARGLKLFSTETVHFRMDESVVTWYMGSLIDNIRWGTLIYDFPRFLPNEKPPKKGEEWQKKIAVDLCSYKASKEELKNPKSVIILFPRIEEGRKKFHLYPLHDRKKAWKALFDNASQKLTETVVLYDRLPFLGFEDKAMAEARLESVTRLAHHSSVNRIAAILSNPLDCWGDLLR
jgi:hypothetical protein